MATVTVIGEVVLDRIIQGDQQHDVLGGSAANTALALVRAGHHVDLRARFGSDEAGQFLKMTAQAFGIDVTNSIDAPERATVVRAIIDDQGVPTFHFDLVGTADWFWTKDELDPPPLKDTVAITTGSPASIARPGFGPIFDWVMHYKQSGIPVFYDPNVRPLVIEPLQLQDEARERLAIWMLAANVVKASEEDLHWFDPDHSPREVAAQISSQGPDLVVLTEGQRGAVAFCKGELVSEVASPLVTIADTVGAGDTVMAWLIHGLAQIPKSDWPAHLESVLQQAVNAAAYTCTRIGADPLTAAEIAQFEQK